MQSVDFLKVVVVKLLRINGFHPASSLSESAAANVIHFSRFTTVSRLMAEGPSAPRRRPGLAWRIAKRVYRRSIRWRSSVPLLATFFTEKEQMLNLAMQYVAFNRIAGDYLEFGCYEGNSFIAAYHFARAQDLRKMRFYAFDSFTGLPPAQGIDQDSDEAVQYSAGDFACDLATFERNLHAAGVSLDRVRLTPGVYCDTLTAELQAALPIRAAAIVMIDCDYYESTRQVLDFVTNVVSTGSVLLFDDWHNFRGSPGRGQQKAFAEWLERHPEITASRYRSFGWHGMSFILHRGD